MGIIRFQIRCVVFRPLHPPLVFSVAEAKVTEREIVMATELQISSSCSEIWVLAPRRIERPDLGSVHVFSHLVIVLRLRLRRNLNVHHF